MIETMVRLTEKSAGGGGGRGGIIKNLPQINRA
jgi:hypothetical protein